MNTQTSLPLNIAVLTISDSRTAETDTSGQYLKKAATQSGHKVLHHAIIPDDEEKIREEFQQCINNKAIDIVISTGGTGVTARDVTVEALRCCLDKEIEGFGEIFRALSYQKIGTSALQSRALAGVANGTYLFALPGSPSACRDAWCDILQHQLSITTKPCNLAELIPRLKQSTSS